MNKKIFNEKTAFIFLIVLTLAVLSMPSIFRNLKHEQSMLGTFPYYHIRVSDVISNKADLNKDPLIVAARPFLVSPYDYLTSFLSKTIVVPEKMIAMLLPILFGVFSVIMLLFILKNHGFHFDTILVSIVILVSSPAFIYSYALSTPLCLVLFLNLLGFLLLSSKNRYSRIIAVPVFLSIPFFGAVYAVATFIFVLLYSIIFKEFRVHSFVIFAAFAFVMALTSQAKLFYPVKDPFVQNNFLREVVAELGSPHGFGFFVLLLALIGVFLSFKSSKRFILFNVTFAGLVVFSIFFTQTFFYLNFIIAIFAAFAFDKMLKMKWQIAAIKNMTLFVIVLGILFSTISSVNRMSDQGPDKEIIASLEFLKNAENGNVLSHYSYGFWIEYYSKKPVLMDGLFRGYDYRKYNFDSNSIYYSRNLETTKNLLNEYKIRYIWMNNDMKNGLVWENENHGLLFLLKNSDDFKKIYNNKEVEIWEYKGLMQGS